MSSPSPLTVKNPLSVHAPALLYRADPDVEDFVECAKLAGWKGPIVGSRTALPPVGNADWVSYYNPPPRRAVIGRYSVLPYYEELETDMGVLGYRLANTYEQHRWIATTSQWSQVLAGITPETYTERWDLLPEGAYVLKGETNSRKQLWNTHMFAPTKADVPTVFCRLLNDSLIGPQGIVARRYYPLKQLGVGINGMPFVHEYRLFYWGTQFLAGGFYWSSFEDADKFKEIPAGALEVGQHAAELCAEHAQFYVLDVAETELGSWIVVEVNDGQMSGLSETDPVALYKALQDAYFRDAFGLHTLPGDDSQRLLDAMKAPDPEPGHGPLPGLRAGVLDQLPRDPRGEIVFGGSGHRSRQVYGDG